MEFSTTHFTIDARFFSTLGHRSFVKSGSTDLVGLLHSNPALKGVLKWRFEDQPTC